MLSAYGVWKIVEGTTTYTMVRAAAAAGAAATNQEKWKVLDKRVLGLIASMLNDNLISHMDYKWAPPVSGAAATFPSVAKVLRLSMPNIVLTDLVVFPFLSYQINI